MLQFTSEGSCRFKDEHRPIDQRPTFVCMKCACLVGGKTLGSNSPSRVFPVWTRLRSSSRRDVWVVQTVGLIGGVPVWSYCSGQQPRVVSVQSDLGTVVLDLLPALFFLVLVLLTSPGDGPHNLPGFTGGSGPAGFKNSRASYPGGSFNQSSLQAGQSPN